jgi:hypothetical protein
MEAFYAHQKIGWTQFKGNQFEDMPNLRSGDDSAYRELREPTTLLSQMLWSGVPNVHGALCTDH